MLQRNKNTVIIHTLCAGALILLCTVLAPFASGAQPDKPGPTEPEKKIRILVLVDASKPLSVRYNTKGRALWGALSAQGLATIFIEAEMASHERSTESKLLQQTVGQFDRRPVFEAGMTAMFKASTPYFEAVVPQDPSLYGVGTAIDLSKVTGRRLSLRS